MFREMAAMLLLASIGLCAPSDWVDVDNDYPNYNHAVILMEFNETDPFYVSDGAGGYDSYSGEFFYVRSGLTSSTECDGLSTSHVFYDISRDVFYCAVAEGYSEYPVREVDFFQDHVEYDLDLPALYPFASGAKVYLENLKENFIGYLKNGSGMMNLSTDWSFFDEYSVQANLDRSQMVYVRHLSSEGKADHISASVLLPIFTDYREFDRPKLLTHELAHVFLGTIKKGIYTYPFGNALYEGEADFFTGLVNLGKNGTYTLGGYREGQYAVATYARVLGGDKFFRITLAPFDHSLSEEMDLLMGEAGKYLKMNAYFGSGRGGSPQTENLVQSMFVLSELEEVGYNVSEIMADVDPWFPCATGNYTFYERFGFDETESLNDQLPHKIQWTNVCAPSSFDLRDELSDPPPNLVPMLQGVPIMNSLDRESYDIRAQMVGYSIWRDMVESYAEYYNSLSPEDRTSQGNMNDMLWFYRANFALAARFGIQPADVQNRILVAYGTGNPIEIDEEDWDPYFTPSSLKLTLDEWSVDPPYTGSLSGPITEGEANLVPSGLPWHYSRSYDVIPFIDWTTVLSADDNITLEFSDSGWASIIGLDTEFDGLNWTEITECQEITEPGNYYLSGNLTGSELYGYDRACIKISSTSDVNLDCNYRRISQDTAFTQDIGLIVDDSSEIGLFRCRFSNYADSIVIRNSGDVTIESAVIDDKTAIGFSDGIAIVSSNDVNVYRSIIEGQVQDGYKYCTFGIEVQSSYNLNLALNKIENCQYGLYMNYGDTSSVYRDQYLDNDYGIHLLRSTDDTIRETIASNNEYYGISILYGSNNVKLDDTLTDNNGIDGIYISDSTGTDIDPPSSCMNGNNGLSILNSGDTTVVGLVACMNGNAGIEVNSSSETSITNCDLSGNLYGLYFDSHDTNQSTTLDNNTFTGNFVDLSIGGDTDGDSVADGYDRCPATMLPESVPTKELKPDHYACTDDDGLFETTAMPGKTIVDSGFSIEDTYGCSCEQILAIKPGLDIGEEGFGCTEGTLYSWINGTDWAEESPYPPPSDD